ncbi:MAG: DUF423 domain-containing protein [Pseudomonadota bacterium]
MILIALAGLLGGGGVALAAIAAHVEDTVAIRAAAELAMVHAVGVIALVAFAKHAKYQVVWSIVTTAMLIGAALFSSAVTLASLADLRPIPGAAPIGGSLTILAWVGVFAAGVMEWMGKDATDEPR